MKWIESSVILTSGQHLAQGSLTLETASREKCACINQERYKYERMEAMVMYWIKARASFLLSITLSARSSGTKFSILRAIQDDDCCHQI